MNESFATRLLEALNGFFDAVMRFLPGLLAAVLIWLLGFILAWLLKSVVGRLLAAARFDRLAESSGAAQLLARADVRVSPAHLAATCLFWVVFVSFAMAGLSALDIQAFDRLTTEFFLYLPRVFAALLILLAGFLLANFFARAALLAAVNAGLAAPRVLSLAVRLLVGVFAFAMALEQLQIGRNVVIAAFVISFGSVMLSLAIAFGIGGKEVARRVLERHFEEKEKAPGGDGLTHL